MKRLGVFTVGLFFLTCVVPSGSPLNMQQAAASEEQFLPATAAFVGRALPIPMRDGKTLAADVYVPRSGGKFPVVLIQTPYDKRGMRTAFDGSRPGAQSLFADTSLAFVISDWRGFFASKSAQTPGTQANMGQDGFDTIAWIVKQPWSNGKVGTWGGSALGKVQYDTARENPPNLIAAVPSVMALNLDYDAYFPGGVLWEEFPRLLGRIGFGTSIFDELTAHPVKDEYWQKRDSAPATLLKGSDLRVPMLFIGGWYDIYTDRDIAAFQAARTEGGEQARAHSRLIMGPWWHHIDELKNGELEYPNAVGYAMQKTRAFMDYWMKGAPNGFDKQQPVVNYYQMGVNEWRAAETWPPQGSRERAYYLRSDRSLSATAPTGHDQAVSFTYNPANPAPTVGGHEVDPTLHPGSMDQREKVESRSDVLLFSTPVLDRDLAIAGKVEIKVFVSSDRPDTDFTAILTDVYPDGRSMLVTEGAHRMRFRNTTSKEELMKPGEIYPVTIDLTNTALTFLKGHRARVILSSSNYPRFALNLNDGGPMYKKGPGLIATNRVYHDAQHPSALLLPIVDR